MDRKDLEALRDETARHALGARERIEVAIERGELPVWVLDACNALEFSAVSHGAARARLKDVSVLVPASRTLH